MKKILATVLLSIGLVGYTNAGEAPQPCGPAAHLSAEFSKNVGADARCFELRMYTAEPAVDGKGGIDDLHQRFREEEVAIFEKHGAEVVAVWQRLDDPNTLVWMLAYRDRAHRTEVWAGFAAGRRALHGSRGGWISHGAPAVRRAGLRLQAE